MAIERNPNPRLTRRRRRIGRTTGSIEPRSDLAATWDRVRVRDLRMAERGHGPEPLDVRSPMIRGLRAFIRDRGIRKIIDVSVGDMDWWPLVLGDAPPGSLLFRGYDISPNIVRANRIKFADREDWSFEMGDARFQDFPSADLVVCRRTMNHLWSGDAAAIKKNIGRKAHLVALTHDPTVRANPPDGMRYAIATDCPRATPFTPMNMRRPPFMPMPIVHSIDDEDDQLLAFFPGRGFGS